MAHGHNARPPTATATVAVVVAAAVLVLTSTVRPNLNCGLMMMIRVADSSRLVQQHCVEKLRPQCVAWQQIWTPLIVAVDVHQRMDRHCLVVWVAEFVRRRKIYWVSSHLRIQVALLLN